MTQLRCTDPAISEQRPGPFAGHSEIVTTESHRVELLDPVAAGKHDPPMQEWLALPVSDVGCPGCGGEEWGTINCIGYFPVRRCNSGCDTHFRGAVTSETIRRIVGALTGEKIRLWRGGPVS